MTSSKGVIGCGAKDRPGKKSRAERRKRTSSLATAGGMANVSVIAAYQNGVFDPKDLDILECRHEVVKRVGQVNDGNTVHVVGLLMAQALALNSIFTKLSVQAAQVDERDLRKLETYIRLALKAQSQSRATLEALVAVGNPPVLFAQQANVAFGPQQVNNGTAPPAGSGRAGAHASENQSEQSKLLEIEHGERMDFGAQDSPVGTHQDLAPVGEVNRADKRRR